MAAMIIDSMREHAKDFRQSNIEFLNHRDLPLGSSDCLETEISIEDTPLKCGFCTKKLQTDQSQTNTEIKVHCFAAKLIHVPTVLEDTSEQSHLEPMADYWYLCSRCFDQGIRFCQYSDEFHFPDELVQLADGIVIHSDNEDIIKTYQLLPTHKEKNAYLDMCGITRDIVITTHNLTV